VEYLSIRRILALDTHHFLSYRNYAMDSKSIGQSAAILNSDFVAIAIVKNRSFVWANDAMHRISGYSPNELIGQNTRLLFLDQESYEAFGKEVNAAITSNSTYRTTIPQRRKDGTTTWFEFNVSQLADSPDHFIAAIVDRTESHILHNELAISEEHLRHAMEAAQAGSWQANPATGEFSASERALQIHGLPPNTVMIQGEAMTNAHLEDRPKFEAAMQHTLATGEPLRLEHRIRYPDGTAHWVESYAVRQHANGQPVLMGFVRDITETKQREQLLLQANQRLGLAQSAARAGVWDWDIPSGKLYWSAELFALFGLPPDAMASFETWRAAVHPDDLPKAEGRIQASIEQHTPLTNHYRIILPDQHERWIDAYGETAFDDQGKPVRMTGICLDVTPHKLAEQSLIESEERLEMALSGSGLGIWDHDVPKRKLSADHRWYEMLGYSPDELGDNEDDWLALIDPRDRGSFDRALAAHLQGEMPYLISEHRMRHKDGHWVVVEARGKVTRRDPHGNPLRVVGTVRDISQHKRLNVEGVELLQRIETLIRETTFPTSAQKVDDAALGTLTKRERQVLVMIAEGNTSAQIGKLLNLSTNTVINHRQKFMSKLDLHSTAEVTRFAIEQGLLSKL
jgi:PAS domain S-box-containing protein